MTNSPPLNPAIGVRLVSVRPPHVDEDFIEAAVHDRRDDLGCNRLCIADTFGVHVDDEHVVSRRHFGDDPRVAFFELGRARDAQFPEQCWNGGEWRDTTRGIRPVDRKCDQRNCDEPDDAATDREQSAHSSLVE